MRFRWVSLGLAVLLMIPFVIWDELFTDYLSSGKMKDWFDSHYSYGWLVGIVLLVGDLFLPIPGTVVMSVLGNVYGPVAGGIVSAIGSFLAGMLGYGLCRCFGHGVALKLAGASDPEKGEHLFERSGGWMVALSRCLPLLPEVIACLAGLASMPLRKFTVALACGAVPVGFVFAWIGHLGQDRPALAIGLSLAIPPVLWLLSLQLMRRKH